MKKQDEVKIEKLVDLVRRAYPKLDYHNSLHGFSVWAAARELSRKSSLSYGDRLALEAGALLHDKYHDNLVAARGLGENEDKTARFATKYMYLVGFDLVTRQKTAKVIRATKMPQKPKDHLEELMCDADLYSLGSNQYMTWQDRLRREWGKEENLDWWKLQYNFLTNHRYHSEEARELWGEQKKRNIEKVMDKLKEYEKVA